MNSISEKNKSNSEFNFNLTFELNFFNRIWPIQLCVDPNIWCNTGIGHNGFMWNWFRAPSVTM